MIVILIIYKISNNYHNNVQCTGHSMCILTNVSLGMYELSNSIKLIIRSVTHDRACIIIENMYYNREMWPCYMHADGERHCIRKVIA